MPKVDLGGVALGKQRLGVNLLSLMAALREEGRLPFRTVQWYLSTVHQLRLSLGAIVRAIHQVARQAQPAVDRILERIRGSPVVHADETGWREDGANGYAWTFSTPTERYFLRRGRHKEVVDEVLDESFSGVLVSDFYAAYHHYPGLKQRCWVHLLRDIHDPEDPLPQRPAIGPVGGGSPSHLLSGQELRPSPGTATAAGPAAIGAETADPVPSLRPRPGSRPRQPVPAYREAHQGTVVFVAAPGVPSDKQRCGAQPATLGGQPQNQRRHPLGAGHRHQDDPGFPLRDLAGPGPRSSRGMPQAADFPQV